MTSRLIIIVQSGTQATRNLEYYDATFQELRAISKFQRRALEASRRQNFTMERYLFIILCLSLCQRKGNPPKSKNERREKIIIQGKNFKQIEKDDLAVSKRNDDLRACVQSLEFVSPPPWTPIGVPPTFRYRSSFTLSLCYTYLPMEVYRARKPLRRTKKKDRKRKRERTKEGRTS